MLRPSNGSLSAQRWCLSPQGSSKPHCSPPLKANTVSTQETVAILSCAAHGRRRNLRGGSEGRQASSASAFRALGTCHQKHRFAKPPFAIHNGTTLRWVGCGGWLFKGWGFRSTGLLACSSRQEARKPRSQPPQSLKMLWEKTGKSMENPERASWANLQVNGYILVRIALHSCISGFKSDVS